MPEHAQPADFSAHTPTRFSSALPVIILTRRAGTDDDWQEVDRGPGYFNVPVGQEIRVRIKGISDAELAVLIEELQDVSALRFLDLSENRNVTNSGMEKLKSLKMLTGLNLSSVSVTNTGLESLRSLPNLEYLDLSYCNKLSDPALKTLEAMRNLTFVDIQGCLGISKGGLSRVRRRSLTIFR